MKNPDEVIGKFMLGIGAIIEHPTENKILLIRRAAEFETGRWEFVYGRINQGEELLSALRREIIEEVGLQVTVKSMLRMWHGYRGAEAAENEIFGITFVCTALSATPILSEEHNKFSWTTLDEAREMITAFGIKKDFELYLSKPDGNQVIFTDLREGVTTL
jgi:8-oxo-dGTP diphosphatase